MTFADWLLENDSKIKQAQIDDAHDWVREKMVNAPELAVFVSLITEGYDKNNWRNNNGKRNGKEAFNAHWTETKTRCPLLQVTVNNFARDKTSWNGGATITRLWEAALGERRDKREHARQAKAREYERQISEYNAMCDAEERARRDAGTARHLAAALTEYERLPEAEPGAYFREKGFGGVRISGLKRGHHEERGGYDMLPIRNAETGEITSLACFYDKPFKNEDGEMVRKIFASGGQIGGCAIFLNGFPPKNFAGAFEIGEGAATVLTVKGVQDTAGACYVAALNIKGLEPVQNALKRRCRKAAAFRLIFDNDWKKALEIDPETGANKQNAGLELGSELAMRRNLRFYLPDFSVHADAAGSLSDFNDLMRVAGADEVKRQLTLRYADPDVVFRGEREKEAARLQAVFAAHDVTTIHERYVPPDLIQEGRVNLVISAPGTGKSNMLHDLYARNPEKSGMVIAPLAALAVNKAEDLGDACYQDFQSDPELRQARRLVICQDSLPRLVPSLTDDLEADEMPTPQILTLEEPATLFDRQLGDISYKVLVRNTMRTLFRNAETALAIDADLDAPELAQLERWRPGDRFKVIINTHPAAVDVYLHDSQNDLQTAALEAHEAGENLAYPCTTAAAARQVDALFRERGSEPGLVIIAANDGDAKVKAFTKRPNVEVHNYRYVAYSPKWETGLSVDRGHRYTRLFGEVNASIDAPRRVMQRAARFREIGRWDLFIDPTVHTLPSDADEIRARWGTSLSDWDSELLGLTADRRKGIGDADYEQLMVDKTVAENIAKSNLRYNLLRRLYARGATLHFLRPRHETVVPAEGVPQAADLITERKALDRAAEYARVMAARAINDATAVVFDRIPCTKEQSDELTAYRVRRTHGLRPEDPLEERHLSEYRDGTLEVQLHRLERAGADPDTLRKQHERRHEFAERYRADDRFYGVEAWAYRTALEVYYVDPRTYTVTNPKLVSKNSPAVQKAIEAFIVRRDDLRAAGFKLPSPGEMRADPLRVIGNIFRKLNLTTEQPGKNKAGRERKINVNQLSYMRDLITARREREEEKGSRVDEGTVKAINTNTLVDCPQLTVPGSSPTPELQKPWRETFDGWLESGKLNALGPQKLQFVQTKLEQNDHEWLYRLAASREVYSLVGLTKIPNQVQAT